MKAAKFERAVSVELNCPECGGACFDLERGSYLIEDWHEEVQCEDCGKRFKVPALAIFSRKSQEKAKAHGRN